MDFKQLEYFCALAREKHFAKAAKACFITQPTLSNSIKKLEAELNVELVIRGHNFIALTTEGQHFLIKAEALIADYHELKRSLNTKSGQLQGILRVGVVPQCQLDIIPLIKSFRDVYPNVKVQMAVLTNQQIMEQLANHAIDLGLGFQHAMNNASRGKFDVHFQGQVKLAVLLTDKANQAMQVAGLPSKRSAPKNAQTQSKPISKPAKILLQDITTFPLCLLSQDMQFRQYIDELLQPLQKKVDIVFETNSVFHLISAVKAGIGCALVTLETAKHAELPYREISEAFEVAETVLIARRKNNSLVSTVFIEHCLR
ncbi:LysR family transcriptional regulator [Algibacillus agarilyticus]|uniref:LysR family transcriptional regulator n=1 Tax=Algibacillus agarilyticus TaxID=2234133 RepID=UPI000DCFEDE2|nr:LysR family transcriptional regulator [Algibacillus agarilyticus]